jgi:hypothetical protein
LPGMKCSFCIGRPARKVSRAVYAMTPKSLSGIVTDDAGLDALAGLA